MFTDLCSQDIWLHNGAKYPKHEYKIQTIWGNTSTHNPLKSPLKCIVSLFVAHENLKPALCAAYRADIFVLSSIVLSPAHELWKCLEVTKHSLQPRDSFTELRDVMDVCKSVCVYVCIYNSVCVNPFTTVLIKKKDTDCHSPPLFFFVTLPKQHVHHDLSRFYLFLTRSCHNKTNWGLRFSFWALGTVSLVRLSLLVIILLQSNGKLGLYFADI